MKAYLIPGSGEGLKDRDYQAVLNTYKELGYEPKFVPIDWKYKVFDDYIEQVKAKIPKADLEKSLLSGFSWGAMVALITAAQYANPKKLALYSLSPYFAEDLPKVKKTWLQWAGKRRVENLKEYSMNSLVKQIKCPTVILVGSKEVSKYSDMRKRTKEAHKRIKNNQLVEIEGVNHDVGDPLYVKSIREALK